MNMLPCILQTWVLVFLVISPTLFAASDSGVDLYSSARKRHLRGKVQKMFYHAYENYSTHAFPHDELKPLTKIFTYSLSELGNPKLEHLPQDYSGSAHSLIESLSSIRILGGLVSAHILATDSANRLVQGSYKNQRFGTSFSTCI